MFKALWKRYGASNICVFEETDYSIVRWRAMKEGEEFYEADQDWSVLHVSSLLCSQRLKYIPETFQIQGPNDPDYS